MHTLPTPENPLTPAFRWKIPEMCLADVDFAREAAEAYAAIAHRVSVAFELDIEGNGTFVDARTRRPEPEVADQYSRMKHGDLDAVSVFAGHLAAAAIRTEGFLAMMRHAVARERVIYITTAAVFNVPSASNLLLRETASRLNIMLTRMGLAPMVVVELTRLSDNALGYSSKVARDRRDGLAAGRGVTLVPEYFRDQCVVFLDDLISTGYTVQRAEHRLQQINAADHFYLFAARIAPQAVGASRGQIEDWLNDHAMGETLQSVGPLLGRGNVTVVQKLVKVVLDPKHTDQLAGFLREIPSSSILQIYAAAASDGFWERRERFYLPSLVILEHTLQERGVLDAAGHIVTAPAGPQSARE